MNFYSLNVCRYLSFMKISVLKIIIIYMLLLNACVERELFTEPGINPGLGGDYKSISGNISGLLKKSAGPFLVTDYLFVEADDTLIIEPGVRFYFKDGVSFHVSGKIEAIATPEQPIVFTAFLNDWQGIQIVTPTDKSEFKFCVFEKVYLPQDNPLKYGAIRIDNAEAEFTNCTFQNNYVQYGGGMAIEASDVLIQNCIFYNNEAVVYGGAVLSDRSSNKIINNTFFRNYCINYGGGIVLVDPVNEEIQNNIFYDNHSYLGDPRIEIVSGDSSNVVEQYNFLAFGNMNPLFISATDLHLQANSPCIDAGNPDPQYNDVNGTRNDQGAYGGLAGDW